MVNYPLICHCLELCSCHDKFIQLVKDRDEWKEKALAYKQVALNHYSVLITGTDMWHKPYAQYQKPEKAGELVDAEMERIREGRENV